MQCPEVPLQPRPDRELCMVACGCFWGPQPKFQALAGVDRCVVGYAGGIQPNPTYASIQDYTEALLVEFDPSVVSYTELLNLWQTMQSGYSSKRQYRSAIMYLNEEQAEVARELTKGEKYVDVEPATKFYLAEEYHQDHHKKMNGSRQFY
jgi:peptide-methionine (S)-S-oxide reductase